MREPIKTALILIIGWSFIILGVIGLFLPVLQGILFLLLGLYILAKRSRLARQLVKSLSRRFPGIALQLKEAQHKGEAFLEKVKAIYTKPRE